MHDFTIDFKEINKKNQTLLNSIKILKLENIQIKRKIKKIKTFMKNNNNISKRLYPNEEDLIYKCPVNHCPKRYQKQNYLVTHIKLKHKNIYSLPKFQKGRRTGLKPFVLNYEDYIIK